MKGSCLCGGVQYEALSLDSPIEHCSCNTCRKSHGAAFNTSAAVNPENFTFLRGEDLLRAYESSPGKFRHFCSVCGSHMLAKYSNRPYLLLRVATLDDDPFKVPEKHIWKAHERPWLAYDSNIPQYPEWQPDHE